MGDSDFPIQMAGKYFPEMSQAKQAANLALARGGQAKREFEAGRPYYEFAKEAPALQREEPRSAFDRVSFGFNP